MRPGAAAGRGPGLGCGLLVAAAPLLFFLGDVLRGTPSPWRLGWVLGLLPLSGLLLWRTRAVAGRVAGARAGDLPGGRLGPAALDGLVAGGWFAVLSALSLAHHRAFGDLLAYDTAYYHQVLWNTGHGRCLAGTILQTLYYSPPLANDLGLHVSPGLLLLLPFHVLLPSPVTLLLLRNLALALAFFPAARLAGRLVGPAARRPLALALLVHPAVAGLSLHAFYPVTFALLPLLWALVALVEGRWRAWLVWLGLALLWREDVGLPVAALGGLILLLGPARCGVPGPEVAGGAARVGPARGGQLRWRWGLPPLLGGLGWLLLGTGVLMPRLGGAAAGQAVLGWYAVHGGSAGEIAGRLLGDPAYLLASLLGGERPGYLFALGRPFALLFLGGPLALASLPGLALNLLAGGPAPPTLHPASHYSTLLVPLLFAGALQTLGRWRNRPPAAVGWWAGPLLLGLALSALPDAWPRQELARLCPPPQAAALRAAAALVPPGASVTASSHLLPLVASTAEAYSLERIFASQAHPTEYVLHDADPSRTYIRPAEAAAAAARWQAYRESPDYATVFAKQGVTVLRRRLPPVGPHREPEVTPLPGGHAR